MTGYGEPGELWVKGPGVMKGYWENKKATMDVLVDGWLRTGDVAVKDEKGYFKIIDRLKDVIIVSGYKVWPNEVEEVLRSHPSIDDSAVIPHHTDLGTKVKAILVQKPGFDKPTLKEIRAFCKKYLAPYEIPSMIEYRKELPRSMVGKVLRRELRSKS